MGTGNFISSNSYDPTNVDTSAKWRPKVSSFPYEEPDDFDEEIDYDEDSEIDDEVFTGQKWKHQESGDFLRGDPTSFGRAFQAIALEEEMGHRSGISPVAGLYKNISGPPLGTGGAGQAFKTTGNYQHIGDFRGFSRGNIKDAEKPQKPKLRIKDIMAQDMEESDHKLLENFFLNNRGIFSF